eukprot:Amastigsp_a509230_64.p2 type:complete len:205 gc:universal Amastigsp_a509230_64:899-285(-)
MADGLVRTARVLRVLADKAGAGCLLLVVRVEDVGNKLLPVLFGERSLGVRGQEPAQLRLGLLDGCLCGAVALRPEWGGRDLVNTVSAEQVGHVFVDVLRAAVGLQEHGGAVGNELVAEHGRDLGARELGEERVRAGVAAEQIPSHDDPDLFHIVIRGALGDRGACGDVVRSERVRCRGDPWACDLEVADAASDGVARWRLLGPG